MGVALLVVGMHIQFAVETWARFGNYIYVSPLGRSISYVIRLFLMNPRKRFVWAQTLAGATASSQVEASGELAGPSSPPCLSSPSLPFPLLESKGTGVLFSY